LKRPHSRRAGSFQAIHELAREHEPPAWSLYDHSTEKRRPLLRFRDPYSKEVFMFRPKLLFTAALTMLFTLASLAAAQNHDDKYITGGSVLYKVDGTLGTATTIFDNTGTAYDMAMDIDNKSLWFGQSGSPGGLFKVDLTTLAITTMILDSMALSSPRDMVLNQDGDLVFTSTTDIYKYSGGKITTIATAPATATNWYGGMEIDIDTGRYVLQAKNSPYALIAIDDAGTIATLGTGGNPRYSITQDIRTGDWYQGSFSSLYLLKQGTSSFVQVTLSGASAYYYALACDRASAANPRIVSLHNNGATTSRLNYTDLTSYVVTLTTLNFGIYNYETEFFRGNDLCTAKTGTGKWSINLSLPNEAGKNYVMAMSLTGVRPGIPLPDGRRINLALDGLTILTIQNLIPTIFNPGPGALSATGQAAGWLDVNGLPPLSGVRVWVEALVVGPGSIGTIVDPVGITL